MEGGQIIMKNDKKKAPVSKKVIILSVLAVALLAFSSFQGARAALTYYSDDYVAQVEMRNIGITLYEESAQHPGDPQVVNYRDGYNGTGSKATWEVGGDQKLLTDMLEETDGKLLLDHPYTEKLTVSNSAEIDQFVKVCIYKRWVRTVDGETVPDTELEPAAINLNVISGSNGWILDKSKTTKERTVLYSARPLKAGEMAKAFTDTLTLEGWVTGEAETKQWTEKGVSYTRTTYDYDDVSFIIEVEADAVQTHNAEDAIKSAWGVDVNVDENKNLSLRQ